MHYLFTILLIASMIYGPPSLSQNQRTSRLSHTKCAQYIFNLQKSITLKIKMFISLKRGLCHGCAKAILLEQPLDISKFINTELFYQKSFLYQEQEKQRRLQQAGHTPGGGMFVELPYDPKALSAQLIKLPSPCLFRIINKNKSHSIFVDHHKYLFYCNENGLFTFDSLMDMALHITKEHPDAQIIYEKKPPATHVAGGFLIEV